MYNCSTDYTEIVLETKQVSLYVYTEIINTQLSRLHKLVRDLTYHIDM